MPSIKKKGERKKSSGHKKKTGRKLKERKTGESRAVILNCK
jgi:hypothetical protein